MTADRSRPTPHIRRVDLSDLRGVVVLGEPLEILASAVLRIRVRAGHDGGYKLDFSFPKREAQAFRRAMGRVAPGVHDGPESDEKWAIDRFVLVVERVSEACRAVNHGRERGRARSMFEKTAPPG